MLLSRLIRYKIPSLRGKRFNLSIATLPTLGNNFHLSCKRHYFLRPTQNSDRLPFHIETLLSFRKGDFEQNDMIDYSLNKISKPLVRKEDLNLSINSSSLITLNKNLSVELGIFKNDIDLITNEKKQIVICKSYRQILRRRLNKHRYKKRLRKIKMSYKQSQANRVLRRRAATRELSKKVRTYKPHTTYPYIGRDRCRILPQQQQ